MPTDEHRELCSRMLLPDSERLARRWEIIADATDAKLLVAMPGTADELAGKTGLDAGEVERRARALFTRGAVFLAPKPQGLVFRAPRHLIQFHDASNQWTDAPRDFQDLWKEFMTEEYPPFLKLIIGGGFPPFMRVVPAMAAARGLADLQPADDLRAMIEGADDLAVCPCPCSRVERNCDPSGRCLQVGKGARYVIERGTGERLTREQALDLLRAAEERGLIHTVENKQATGTVICNCCTCCCAIIKPGLDDPDCRPIITPSRFRPAVEAEACTGDGFCHDVCPVGAVAVDGDLAVVDADRCLGCGLCLDACPAGALDFQAVQPIDSIP